MTEREVPSVEQLYKTILRCDSFPLPGMEAILREKAWEKANRIHGYLLDRADRGDGECLACDSTARKSQTRYVYDTPWDEEESEKRFCSEECGDEWLYGGDFAYATCQKCEREICQQNPANGWHWQFRDYDGDQVCLKCYEGLVLENGIEREKLESGKIPGMFFSYGNPEPIRAGYREVDGFKNYFVRTHESADRFRKKALELMEQGKKVVIGYESMGIGGGEGYVTLLEKVPERTPKDRNHQRVPSGKGVRRGHAS